MNTLKQTVMIISMSMFLGGCAVMEKASRTDELEKEIARLEERLAQLKKDKVKETERIAEEKNQEISELERAKKELEESLQKEIGEYKAKLQMTDRGLVITFLSEIFFDSGKDILQAEGKNALKKIAPTLNNEVGASLVAIEGHTDNVPIKYSGWRSNWELSSARALAVVHYLVDECGVDPERLSANGYGQYHPVAANDTVQNRQKNRRVEIVILPAKINKVKAGEK